MLLPGGLMQGASIIIFCIILMFYKTLQSLVLSVSTRNPIPLTLLS